MGERAEFVLSVQKGACGGQAGPFTVVNRHFTVVMRTFWRGIGLKTLDLTPFLPDFTRKMDGFGGYCDVFGALFGENI